MAASHIVNGPYDLGNICFDPLVHKEGFRGKMRWVHEVGHEPGPNASILPLESTRLQRKDKRIYDDELPAVDAYEELMLALYSTIPLEKLPRPGVLRLRRVCYPHILNRELVQRGRAVIKQDKPVLKFIYEQATPEIFQLIVECL